MRRELAGREGQRKKFTASFARVGKKTNYNGYAEDTLLLTDVRDAETGDPVADHVWFTYSKTFENANLKPGMKISFEARVKEYVKGYVSKALGVNRRRRDLKLSHPTKISVIPQ